MDLLRLLESWGMTQKWQQYLFLVVTWHNVLTIVCNCFMMCIYKLNWNFFERYKIQTEPWPWEDNYEEWMVLLKKSIKQVAINSLMIQPVAIFLSLIPRGFQVEFSFDEKDLPDTKTLALSITFFMLVEDFCFHHLHKLLHTKKLYRMVHKVHHTHKVTISIAAEYAHPLEFVLSNMIPFATGPLILQNYTHFYTLMVWFVVRMMESIDGHCGYEFSWSPYRLIPFSTSASYHDFHHSHNIGNYSSFFQLWDSVNSTNKVYFQHCERLAIARRKYLQKKSDLT